MCIVTLSQSSSFRASVFADERFIKSLEIFVCFDDRRKKNDPFFSLSPLEFKIFSRIRADWMGRERQDKNRRSMLLRFAISKTRRNAALYRYNRERYVRSEDSYRFLLTFPTSLNSVCHSRNVYRSDRNALEIHDES